MEIAINTLSGGAGLVKSLSRPGGEAGRVVWRPTSAQEPCHSCPTACIPSVPKSDCNNQSNLKLEVGTSFKKFEDIDEVVVAIVAITSVRLKEKIVTAKFCRDYVCSGRWFRNAST